MLALTARLSFAHTIAHDKIKSLVVRPREYTYSYSLVQCY